MFERLRLIDFQPHERREVRLSPTITTFVGPSDVGKTAILRALKWALLGRPSGADFIRHGADKCAVGLLIDAITLVRERNATTSTYRLGKKSYKAFGQSLPSEIRNFVNVSEVNFQNQLDPPFWISLTPGELARRLNEITGLELADRVLANIAVRIRKLRTTAEVIEDRLKKAKQKQEELAYIVTLDKDLEQLEELQQQKLVKYDAATRLRARIAGCQELSIASSQTTPSMDGLTKNFEQLQVMRDQHDALQQRCETVAMLDSRIEELDRIIVSKKQQTQKLTKGRCPICGGPLNQT